MPSFLPPQSQKLIEQLRSGNFNARTVDPTIPGPHGLIPRRPMPFPGGQPWQKGMGIPNPGRKPVQPVVPRPRQPPRQPPQQIELPDVKAMQDAIRARIQSFQAIVDQYKGTPEFGGEVSEWAQGLRSDIFGMLPHRKQRELKRWNKMRGPHRQRRMRMGKIPKLPPGWIMDEDGLVFETPWRPDV